MSRPTLDDVYYWMNYTEKGQHHSVRIPIETDMNHGMQYIRYSPESLCCSYCKGKRKDLNGQCAGCGA